jgi:protease-4
MVAPWEEPIFDVENGVATLAVAGPLVKGYDPISCWFWGLASLDRIEQAAEELAGRADVAVVVLDINSPGGMSSGTPECAAAVARMAEAGKLTVAFTDTMACSAAYWLACACSTIVCTVSCDIGCIGTYIALYDFTKMLEQEGISLELFKRGSFKALGIPGAPLTDEQRTLLDDMVGRTNDRFTGFVKARRGAVADSTMQGQWFDGEQAVALNLADRTIGSRSQLLGEISAALAASIRAVTI